MAFDLNDFDWIARGNTKVPNICRFVSSSDNWATITASAYFNDLINDLKVNDLIIVQSTTERGFLRVNSVTTNVTTVHDLYPNPAYVARYAGTHAYGGGGTSTAITVTGVLASDIPMASIKASTNNVSVTKVVPTADTITVHFSADPGASTTVQYIVDRAV